MELIKIETNERGEQLVNARELYEFLGFDKSQWTRWYKKNIVEDTFFKENIDYEAFDIMSNGNKTKDFILKLGMAKEISMLARNEKGKQARQYFIEAEKTLKKIVNKNIIADAKDKRIIELTRDLSEAVKHSEKVIKTVDETMENLRGELEEVLKKETREAVNKEIEKEIHNQVIVAVTRTVAERFAVYIDKLNRLGDWIENHKVIEDVETLKKRVTELEKEIRTIKKSNK